MVGLIVPRIISIIGVISLLLAGSSYVITWKDIDIKLSYIKTGNGIKNDPDGLKWFSGVSLIFCGLISLGVLIYEVILICNPIKFKFFKNELIRAIVYFYIAATVLGVAGDLGISSCAFCLLSFVINVFVYIAAFCECITIEKGGSDAGKYQKANDVTDDSNKEKVEIEA